MDNLLHMCSSNFNEQLPLSVYTKKPSSQSKTNELFASFTFRGRVWLPKAKYICITLIFDRSSVVNKLFWQYKDQVPLFDVATLLCEPVLSVSRFSKINSR